MSEVSIGDEFVSSWQGGLDFSSYHVLRHGAVTLTSRRDVWSDTAQRIVRHGVPSCLNWRAF